MATHNKKYLRQREWAIYIHPYYVSSKGNIIWYDGVPKAGKVSDFGDGTGQDTPVVLKGHEEGKPSGSTMEYDEGCWVMWFKTNSFPLLREKYKEILNQTGKENTRIVELMPVDTLVTPLS